MHAVASSLTLFCAYPQIQPEKEIIVEFIKNEDFKYVRVLGAFYLRLVGRPVDIYQYLEPLYNDFRKVRKRVVMGWELTHIDEIIDILLRDEYFADVALPRLPKRAQLEEANMLVGMRQSALEADLDDDDDEDEDDAGTIQTDALKLTPTPFFCCYFAPFVCYRNTNTAVAFPVCSLLTPLRRCRCFLCGLSLSLSTPAWLLFSFEKMGKQMTKQETSRKKRRRTAIVKEHIEVIPCILKVKTLCAHFV
jgi:hypothetical protein